MPRAPRRERRPALLVCVQGHECVRSVPQTGHETEEGDEIKWVIARIDRHCECGHEIDEARCRPL
jgi:D-arabinose 1-dehydrogenase-like Zn-dependent alcohol dehydrogenase